MFLEKYKKDKRLERIAKFKGELAKEVGKKKKSKKRLE